jgi:hypothetical protein
MLGYLFGSNRKTTSTLMRLEFHRNRQAKLTAVEEREEGQVPKAFTERP